MPIKPKYVLRLGNHVIDYNDMRLPKQDMKERRNEAAREKMAASPYDILAAEDDPEVRAGIQRKINSLIQKGHLPYLSREA